MNADEFKVILLVIGIFNEPAICSDVAVCIRHLL